MQLYLWLTAGISRDVVPSAAVRQSLLPVTEGGEVCFFDRLGIGPWVGGPALGYLLLAAYPCWRWRELARVPLPWLWVAVPGAILLVLGLGLHGWSLVTLVRAWKAGVLARTGPYALVRHPAYVAWILLILPGIALLSGAWPMFLAPVLAFYGFCRHVEREEGVVRAHFGEDYERYCRVVPGRLAPRRATCRSADDSIAARDVTKSS